MRTPTIPDLLILARTLMAHPSGDRRAVATSLISEADVAYRYFRCFEKSHPRFGDGSLMSRVLALSPRPEPMATDIDFLQSLQVAIQVLMMHDRTRSFASQL